MIKLNHGFFLFFTEIIIYSFLILLLFSSIGFTENQKVLLLNSYHQGYQWTDAIVDGITQTLKKMNPTIEFMIEYMDTKRINHNTYIQTYFQMLQLKYTNVKLDAIIASDDNAFQFLLTYHDDIFGQTPVVFCGVNHFDQSMLKDKTNFTGVVQKADIVSTINLALSLHPTTANIVVVSDNSSTGKAYKNEVMQVVSQFPQLQFVNLDGITLTHDEFFSQLHDISNNSIVLLTLWLRDKSGIFLPWSKSMPLMTQHSPVPIYGLVDEPLKYGLIGGKLQAGYYQGQKAAEIVSRILFGNERIQDIPVEEHSPNKYMFNYKQLEKWGISESLLPADSIVIEKQVSFYKKYKYYILFTFFIFILMFVIIVMMSFNIMIRRKGERALRESEFRLRIFFEQAAVGVAQIESQTGRFIRVNKRYCEIVDYPLDKMVQKTFQEITHPDDLNEDLLNMKRLIHGEIREFSMEKRYIQRNGSIVWVDLAVSPMWQIGEIPDYHIAIVQDITHRKNAELALKRIEWMLKRKERSFDPITHSYHNLVQLNTCRLILDSVGDEMLLNIVGDYLDLMETCTAVYEKNGDYALGIFISNWCSQMNQYSRKLCETNNMKEAMTCGKWHCHDSCWHDASKIAIETGKSVDIKCKGGIHIFAVPIIAGGQIIGSINIGYGDPPNDVSELQELAQHYRIPVEQLLDNAKSYESRPPFIIELAKRRLLVSARLIGEIVERKQAVKARDEAEVIKDKLEQQTQHIQKMNAIGTLAGGIAHDFNNILGVIKGNLSFAISQMNKDEELYDVLLDSQEGVKQAQNITQQLLTFAKGGQPIKKVINMNKVIQESAKFITSGSQSKCIFDLSKNLWPVEADEGQMNQVFGNLIINSNQALPTGGFIYIRTQNTQIDETTITPLPSGRYIMISIEDQGLGIPKNHLSHIFEPFFTTKQQGSGLGLATSYSIIKKHGGHITVESEINKGTTFRIYLPATFKTYDIIEHEKGSFHQGNGKILIMDDQQAILKMIERILNRMGYDTHCVTDGVQAIEIYRKAYLSGKPFDLVILDLTVPGGMGGAKTISELLKIDPDVRAIVSSGYSNDPIMANYKDYGFCGIVPKPYTKNQLAILLNQILNEKKEPASAIDNKQKND